MSFILIFKVALFVMAQIWKWFKCASPEEWLNKFWFICTVDYYLAIKRNEPFIHPKMRTHLKIIMQHKKKSDQKYDPILTKF